MDFYKNTKGEYIEGYLSTKEQFNGIVFLLREPNDPNPERFWFRNSLYNPESHNEYGDKKEIRRSKTAATKYINRFSEIIEKYVGVSKDELFNAVYCNVHPEWGDTTESNEYKEIMGQKSVDMFENLIETHDELTVFTCMDIYENIKNHYVSVGCLNEIDEVEGLKYEGKKTMYMFKIKKGNCNIKVYEMFHPSYSVKVN